MSHNVTHLDLILALCDDEGVHEALFVIMCGDDERALLGAIRSAQRVRKECHADPAAHARWKARLNELWGSREAGDTDGFFETV